jgi:hypothetical protein
VAYNLPNSGVDMNNLANNLRFLKYDQPSYWHLAGLFGSKAEIQKAISISGPLHLHGLALKSPASEDKKSVQRGGNINAALAEDVTVKVYPLDESKIFQASFQVSAGQLGAEKVSFKITNNSPLWADHLSVEGISGLKSVFNFRLETFSSFSSQIISVDPNPNFAQDGLLVKINGAKDIFEENYTDNQLVLGRARLENNVDTVVYTRDDSLWQMNSAGRAYKKIPGISDDKQKIYRNPSWSPERGRLAYYAFDRWKAPAISLLASPVPTIYLMDLMTKKNVPIYQPESAQTVVDDLKFSADGRYLYFTLSQADVGESVARVELSDNKMTKMIQGAFQADLSRDGKQMVYVAYNSGYKNVVLSSPSGTGSRILLSYGKFCDFARPVFNPSATRILFSAAPAGSENPLWQLWSYDLTSGTMEKVVDFDSPDPFKVCWSSGGDEIFYSADNKIFNYSFKTKNVGPHFVASGDDPDWY